MPKKFKWTIFLKGIIWIAFAFSMTFLMGFISEKNRSLTCKNIRILIPGADNFIEREEIDEIVRRGRGGLIGKTLSDINLESVEKSIKANPYIAFAKVYADMDGVVNIEIQQRQPILRVINASDQDFYIDKEGLKMPVSSNFTANVLVANGKILEYFSGRVDTLVNTVAKDLYKAALFIRKDSLWNVQIEQIYVNDHKDMELIPRVGKQRIILGNADSIEVKMRNLLAFYKQAIPKVGWNTYKSINIKYTNQVICEKSSEENLSPDQLDL